MKKCVSLLLAAVLCMGLTSCQLPSPQKQLSDEEVVLTLVEAFKNGDYEGLKPFISDDKPLHTFFAGMDPETGGKMSGAYKALYDKVRSSISVTAQAVEGKEAWGTVSTVISAPDYAAAIHDAMVEALADQVTTGSTAFHDMPDWIAKAVAQGSAETREETFELHVGNRDGEMVMDTNTNREFFAMLCGGFKPYLNASITTCTFPDGTSWVIEAQGDEIVAMINTEQVEPDSSYTEEDLALVAQGFMDTYAAVKGITAWAGVVDGLFSASFGVDMENADTFALNNMGIISDRTTAGSRGWLSLDSTISGFTRDGATCVTETFKPEAEESAS